MSVRVAYLTVKRLANHKDDDMHEASRMIENCILKNAERLNAEVVEIHVQTA